MLRRAGAIRPRSVLPLIGIKQTRTTTEKALLAAEESTRSG
jgi:hypothetical protein